MADEVSEYTVRDYSAVDRQIDEIARRERILTNRLNLENLKRFILIGLMVIGGICLASSSLLTGCFLESFRTLFSRVTVKNEPIILNEKSNDTVNQNVPSTKYLIPNTNSNTTNKTNTETKNIIQNEEKRNQN